MWIQASIIEMSVDPLATVENCSLLVHQEVVHLLLSPSSLILLSQHGREGRKVKSARLLRHIMLWEVLVGNL